MRCLRSLMRQNTSGGQSRSSMVTQPSTTLTQSIALVEIARDKEMTEGAMAVIFDWKRFCSRYGIEFILYGPNVAAGNVNIHCPFCDDPSQHLGLSIKPDRPYWGCWRCKTAGKHPYHLVLNLLGHDRKAAAAAIAEQQEGTEVPDAFDTLFTPKPYTKVKEVRTEKAMPPGFRRLAATKSVFAATYLEYLRQRHFPNPLLTSIMGDLHYSLIGDYAGRIILPVYVEGRLVSWVGRKIVESGKAPRYKTEDSGDLKRCLANMDRLEMEENPHKKVMLVGEGPFDYLKLEALLADCQCVSTCTFGTAWTESQLMLLARYARKYGHTFVVYDKEARMEGMRLVSALREVSGTEKISATFVPGRKDPGAMRKTDVPMFVGMLNAMLG